VTGLSYNPDTNSDYATIKYSNAGVPLWTNRYDGPANGSDEAGAIAVDTDGNVIVTGYSTGIDTGSDYATIKYSSSGVPLWTNRYDGGVNSQDYAVAIAVDRNGNVLVTGWSCFAPPEANYNCVTIDYVTIKYSGAGEPLWTNRYDGPANGVDEPSGIAVDSDGNVFVTGGSAGVGTFNDYATIKYSSTGDLLWENRYDYSISGDWAAAIAVDGNGNVFVTGESYQVPTLSDFATVAYSNAGVPLWTRRYNGPANPPSDSANAIALDGSGNVFVTGSSTDASGLDGFATIKYSNAGVPLWTRRYNAGGNNPGTSSTHIAVDSSGNVFVTGLTGYSGDDSVTIAYSNAGVPLWTNRFDGRLGKMAVDRSGNVFVTGTSGIGINSDM